MSDQATARTRPPADGLQALRLLALAAAAAGVGLLAAAAFVLSYSGIHAIALYAGVPPRLARIYPPIFDAMLIVACAAVLSLRGAGLPSRCYAWLSLLGLIVVAAAADTLHATGTRLPHKPTAAVVAIIPWALVLIGFGLLLCMLRQARLRAAAEEEGRLRPSGQAEAATGLDALFGPRVPLAVNGSSAPPEPSADSAVDLAIDTDPGQDDPASDEGSAWTREQQPAGTGPEPEPEAEPEAEAEAAAGTEPEGGDEPEADRAPVLAAAAQSDGMQNSPVTPEA